MVPVCIVLVLTNVQVLVLANVQYPATLALARPNRVWKKLCTVRAFYLA